MSYDIHVAAHVPVADIMLNENVKRALQSFGVTPRRIEKPPDAKLAEVYLVDDRYVLRSRPCLDDARARCDAERKLLEIAARVTGYAFPAYLPCREGEYFFLDGQCLWTLHEMIPGRTLGRWFELHTVPAQVDKQVMSTLRRLHEETRGRFDPSVISRTYFVDMILPALSEAGAFLTEDSSRRIQSSFKRVQAFSGQYRATEACFVHGDFHHGNILTDDEKIVGFIDLDWCRVGSRYEDLGFTLMMLLRDYETWSPEFRRQRYNDILSFYDFDGDASILGDYTALYALFDCHVFKSATFEKAADFYAYQRSFLETLCRTVVRSDG